MTNHFLAGEGALFIQPYGPNTDVHYLGCHMLGDVSAPEGDVTLIFCDDPSGPNRFDVKGSFKGAPGVVTSTLTTDVEKTASYLERLSNCTFPLYVNMYQCGRSDQFPNYHRTFQLHKTRVTNRGLTAISAMTPDDQGRSQQTFDISAVQLSRAWDINGVVRYEDAGLVVEPCADIDFLRQPKCTDNCGEYQDDCTIGVAAAGSAAAVLTTHILITLDSGVTWADMAAVPGWAAGTGTAAAKIFQSGATGYRVLAMKAFEAGQPPEIAYSDNNGAFTLVTMHATPVAGGITNQSLFVYNSQNIWSVPGSVGVGPGYIFFSSDSGVTWTAQDNGILVPVATTDCYTAIHGMDPNRLVAVGTNGVVSVTENGGDIWRRVTDVTGTPDMSCVWRIDQNRIWAGSNDAGAVEHLWYTTDNGTTWNSRTFTGSATAGCDIAKIEFVDELNGYMIAQTGGAATKGTVYRTRNGGRTWEVVTTPENDNLNGMFVCDVNTVWASGDNNGSTHAVIVKAA